MGFIIAFISLLYGFTDHKQTLKELKSYQRSYDNYENKLIPAVSLKSESARACISTHT